MSRIALRRSFGLLAVCLGLALWLADTAGFGQSKSVALLTIKGPIGPAVSDYVRRGLEKAREQGAVAVILQMDTPGGLDTSMREIIQDILASPLPVIGYVGPSGARAASAGTYILYASHVAAMAPATNLGAATPVQLGGGSPFSPPKDDDETEEGDEAEKKESKDSETSETDSDAEDKDNETTASEKDKDEPDEAKGHPGLPEKAINDAIAYIRSLAQMRGRNADWAVKAVSEAASLSAKDALEQNVIDLMADDPQDLLAKADGRTVEVAGSERVLEVAALAIVEIAPDWRNKLLAVITNPTVAYMLLFTIGVPALLIEFYTGTAIAGVVGGICVILGLYGLHVLPIDYAGLGLLVLGLALLVAETLVPSFGVLGMGGLVAFVAGSIMLIDTDVPGFGISPYVIGAIASVGGGLMLITVTMLMRIRTRPVVSGAEEMLGGPGSVVSWSGGQGEVRTHGEIWRARAAAALEPGARVRVTSIEGLTLVVEPETNGS